MFCPACGTANPDDAKFCNACGTRVAPPTLQGPASPGTEGTASLSGMSTVDAVATMVRGPTKRQVMAGAAALSLVAVVGAFAAYRVGRSSAPDAVPVTPVGLAGDPSPVTAPATEETDAGTVVVIPERSRAPRAGRPAQRPTTPAAQPNAAARPTTPARPAAQPNAAAQPDDDEPEQPTQPAPPARPARVERTASGNTIEHDDQGNMTVRGPDGTPLVRVERDAGAAAPTQPAQPSLPQAENGVLERGPRTTRGGYRMGDETDATGTINPAALQFVYRHFQPRIAACWSTASRTETVSGVMVVRVRIAGEDGRVRSTRVVSDTTRNPGLQACVQNEIRTWRYPQPEGGDVEVDYPLRFGGGATR